MEKITLSAHAKINWMLNITGLRPDGYHELDMLMQEIALSDTLTLTKSDATELHVNGELVREPEKNLVFKAIKALEEYTGRTLCVRAELTKRIPSRAGLGGGSSDCASALNGINTLFNLRLDKNALAGIGLRLGADVPFFIYGGLCRVSGIGEGVSLKKDIQKLYLVIKLAGEGLSTPEVYRQYDKIKAHKYGISADEAAALLIEGDFMTALCKSVNMLEEPAVLLLPQIEEVKQELADAGAMFVRMTGSGSAVYGVFKSKQEAERACKLIPDSILTETI